MKAHLTIPPAFTSAAKVVITWEGALAECAALETALEQGIQSMERFGYKYPADRPLVTMRDELRDLREKAEAAITGLRFEAAGAAQPDSEAAFE